MSDKEIAWSTDQENFSHESLGCALESLECAGELTEGRIVWFGDCRRPNPTKYITADDVLDTIGNAAYDDGGEHAEDYPEVSDEAKAELEAFLAEWLTKYCQPTFWMVDNVKEYTVTAADVAEYGATP